jgi:polyhydroxybutyrate depolymerase
MSAKADEEGFLVVYPQALGTPPTWWGPIPNELGQPDMEFFRELLAHLLHELCIDRQWIFATGMSNGATMANRLGCDMADTFAAIAPVSGGHVAFDECTPSRPVPVLAIHGRNDTIIPYAGNPYNPAVHEWVEAWAQRNGCAVSPTRSQPADSVTREAWSSCDAGATVILYTLEEAGHTWPGSEFGVLFGGSTRAIDATDVIWTFFSSHPKSESP